MIRKKYLKIIIITLSLLHSHVYLIGCPTCIGYPEKNKRPFFEEQETEITVKSSNNETHQSDHFTASVTTDNQEENS